MLAAIEGLPQDKREVFDLIGIQGLTHAKAAAVVGVSEKTVQRRLNRAALTAGGERESAPAAWAVCCAGQSSPADARRPRPGTGGSRFLLIASSPELDSGARSCCCQMLKPGNLARGGPRHELSLCRDGRR
jgi:hypothetical protein